MRLLNILATTLLSSTTILCAPLSSDDTYADAQYQLSHLDSPKPADDNNNNVTADGGPITRHFVCHPNFLQQQDALDETESSKMKSYYDEVLMGRFCILFTCLFRY